MPRSPYNRMRMQLGIESQIPDGLLAANALLAETSHQGVPTSTHALHRGFEFAISSTNMSLQFACSESASDPVDEPNNDNTIPSYCKASVLGAVNSQFGTNFANANIQSSFMNGGGANLIITASGLRAAQFNGLQTGRYASGFLNAITGVGPSLHIAGYNAVNDPNAIFNNSNIGGMTSVTFTAHTDSAFADNPFGALLHYILDVSQHGKATRNPCP